MRPRWPMVALGLAASVLSLTTAARAFGATPALDTLQPGLIRTVEQELTVNIVFVGYERGTGPRDIDEARFRAWLPREYQAINRIPAAYGVPAATGVGFTYRFNLVYADLAFEDAFFAYLSATAVPRPLTFYDWLYNHQAVRSRTITATATIDAPAVERWLAGNSGRLGLDTRDYTVFLINWYGRPDFRDHVYLKTNEPDPDTGVSIPALFPDDFATRGWGGTAADDPQDGKGLLRRVWFHDLSAGPVFNDTCWNLQHGDIDGDGRADYRMPPIWEYGNLAGYRPFDDLSGDLGRLVRFVAIDLLFTASPVYNPAISAPRLPSSIQLDINLYQGAPGEDRGITPSIVTSRLEALQPTNRFSSELTPLTFAGRPEDVYECFAGGVSCFGQRYFGFAFGDLELYHSDHLNTFVEGDADYEVPIFVYNLPYGRLPFFVIAFAANNLRDGTQTSIFGFHSPLQVDFGLGFSNSLIHEMGHHVGLSHPHDGYDSERRLSFGPSGDFYFAWVGDESNTPMSYGSIYGNSDFSQFDRDNSDRYLTAAYINQANRVLGRIQGSPRAGQVAAAVAVADAEATRALADYEAMEYGRAAARAQAAYLAVLQAAEAIAVQIEPEADSADYRARGASDHFAEDPPNLFWRVLIAARLVH